VKHIFGVVADPLAARVGINPTNPYDHPKWIGWHRHLHAGRRVAGDGAAAQSAPAIVGLPWNRRRPTRSPIPAQPVNPPTALASTVEGNVENSTVVGEVTDSLVARGAEAILMTGDNTISIAADTVIASARKDAHSVMATSPESVGKAPCSPWGRLLRSGRQIGDLPPVSIR